MSKNTRISIMRFVIEGDGTISTKEAVDLCGGNYFYNGRKHVQESLTRLVNSGDLIRVRRGFYKKGPGGGKKYIPEPDNQLSLF